MNPNKRTTWRGGHMTSCSPKGERMWHNFFRQLISWEKLLQKLSNWENKQTYGGLFLASEIVFRLWSKIWRTTPKDPLINSIGRNPFRPCVLWQLLVLISTKTSDCLILGFYELRFAPRHVFYLILHFSLDFSTLGTTYSPQRLLIREKVFRFSWLLQQLVKTPQGTYESNTKGTMTSFESKDITNWLVAPVD